MDSLLLSFKDYSEPARRLAKKLKVDYAEVDVHTFPDGENKITLPDKLPGNVILCRSLNNPNEKLVELYLVAKAARELGCNRLTFVIPYLCYMRQDTAFAPGEIVSQRWIGKYLGDIADKIITVDPHLHRTDCLSEIFNSTENVNLSAANLIGQWVTNNTRNPFLLGPDEESLQWVEKIADSITVDYAVATKTRHGDRDVDIKLPANDYSNRDIVLVDDIISTGHTLLETVIALKKHNVNSIYCAVTHGLFVDNAYEKLLNAGVKSICSTDSVFHVSNKVELAPLLASAL